MKTGDMVYCQYGRGSVCNLLLTLNRDDLAQRLASRALIRRKYMNSIILAISWGLSKILNPVIVILAAVETGIMIVSYRQMRELKKRIDELNGHTTGKQIVTSRKPGSIRTQYTVTHERDWREFDKFCDDYQKNSTLFSGAALIIQLFPLLGILGTVTGLFIAMNGNADWSNAESLYEGVRFALSSTVLGILFAVIFKSIDIIFNSRFLGYIDDGIDRFRENYNVAKEFPMEPQDPASRKMESQDPASQRTGVKSQENKINTAQNIENKRGDGK